MTTLKLEIELTYDDRLMHGDDAEAREWFFTDVLKRDELLLHSNEIGDTVGRVVVTAIK